jgi:VWFA-related protein
MFAALMRWKTMSRAYCGLVPSLVIILIALLLNPSGGAGARQKTQTQEGRPRSQEGAGQTIRLNTQLVNVLFSNAPPPWARRAPPPTIIGSRKGGTSIFDSVTAACADLLARESGRKTIILFTGGYDTTSFTDRAEAIEEALRAEVVIYAIGIGDLDVDGVDRKALERLCEPTGGRAFVPRDVEDLDQAFGQLEQELRQQYLVAYEPANMTADGKFRKIEAPIANHKGVHVRHRRGYYAPGT